MNRDVIERRIRAVLADVLDLDEAMIRSTTSTENTPSWDSLGHIGVIVALEEEFDLTLTVEEAEVITSVADAVRLVQSKHNGRG